MQCVHPEPSQPFLLSLSDYAYAGAGKVGFPPNPPFGAPALYAWQQRAGITALVNSPGWANLALGMMYALGIYIGADADLARRYLTAAGKEGPWDAATRWLEFLETR